MCKLYCIYPADKCDYINNMYNCITAQIIRHWAR